MRALSLGLWPAAAAALVSGCGGDGGSASLPRLPAATPAPLAACTDLASRLNRPDTTIQRAEAVPAGTLTVAGQPVPAHCRVTGAMNSRVSAVDGNAYAIGFEMRLPEAWNGRFFHQVNGGLDGSVATAVGPVGGGGPLTNALAQGFAVISSDAGHAGSLGPNFGIDPQARLDYGYQAVGSLTPMAKRLIELAYGKQPDRSYLGGCSNGGRHAMVAASRHADQYDGILAGNPGFRLPLAAIANMAGVRVYGALAHTAGDPSTGFTVAERMLVSNAVLARCDALDGVADGLVQDTTACQARFDLQRDVPTCSGARDGSCLSAAQKTGIAGLFSGARSPAGTLIYSSFPYDAGLATSGWASWKYSNSVTRDPGAVGLVWQVPPEPVAGFDPLAFALTADLDGLLAKVNATNATYTESAMSFMQPPQADDLGTLRNRGAKMLVYHGTSDAIFSSDDTTAWYDALNRRHGGEAADFARFYRVPGMGHCSGGPATDQFDLLGPLVAWVEQGQAPGAVTASARGAGNAGGVNADLPAGWSAQRSRPLCPYPQVARYAGSGDLESAASFRCE
ncbi:tannase/feruloyl esterase family alpha/beta hydrolase [Aquincola sp. J276]|uniref:tannase/feruloyl esterase family alpha/beta hydrolase n=1 Tax=Aquincola sp. J276 TaxID=2898432 RepID=UPI0021510CE8|nr:tannase/feruloyl esterase family alpha/beta hydrolase [Aquincola sp. J276]MCR5863773.1 tannase/feruloyl esterase family alpha/beta hydrolase [Aquincola sp. J276]